MKLIYQHRVFTTLTSALILGAASTAIAAEGYAPGKVVADLTADSAVEALVPAQIAERGTLNISVYGNTPYTMVDENGDLFGVVVDLGHAIAATMGLDASIEDNASVGASKVAVQSGRYDIGMGPFLDSPSAEEEFSIINWIAVTPGIVFQRGKSFSKALDFCGHSVAIVSGSVPVERNMDAMKKACTEAGLPEQTVDAYGDQNATVVAVLSGRNDGAMMGSASALYIAKTQADKLDAYNAASDIFNVGLYTGLGVPLDNEELTAAVEASMRHLLDSGTYKAILAEYGVEALMVDEIVVNPITSAAK